VNEIAYYGHSNLCKRSTQFLSVTLGAGHGEPRQPPLSIFDLEFDLSLGAEIEHTAEPRRFVDPHEPGGTAPAAGHRQQLAGQVFDFDHSPGST
jgi:hypothetical protein